MNPGYAGRQELPDNLKALFRPVSMMIPNYGLIAEITMFSEGFAKATPLSQKMARLYSLASEQLSKQKHYDFGMRAVKTVLVMAGKIKREDRDTPEEVILIRAMRDSNVPKFLTHDLPLFFGIIADLFPSTVVPFIDYGKVQIAIENQLRLEKKQIVPDFIKKIQQLMETMIIRHGNMIVGSTGTGKTTVARILAKALTQLSVDAPGESPMYKPVKIDTLNPKSVTKGELYGEANPYTNEWQEGIVSSLVKTAVDCADSTDEKINTAKRWINFDGPVDAMWIESMNTVLDDNKMLCLPNGERIKMPDICTMMFEVNDLVEASPATVSRCGMVYLEPVYLGWKPIIESWVELMTFDPEAEDKLAE
jgi:dynein heavy chain